MKMKKMNIHGIARKIVLPTIVSAVALLPFVSCSDAIYDEEGDCSVTYRIKFRYDLNLKWADAFAGEVGSVRLYAFDDDNKLVWEGRERGSVLRDPGYTMLLDLPAGRYHLIAWCGIDNETAQYEAFSVPEATRGRTVPEDLRCRLNRWTEDGSAYSSQRLEFMFHGEMDVLLPENEDGGEYTYTMPLTKDTNHIRVILQQLSGEDLDVDKFDFRIEDSNGLYAHDNTLLPDEKITYLTWNKMTGTAGLGKDDIGESRAIIYVNGAIADLTVGRMMADHARDMILTITNDKGEKVARVPVIDYALLSKEYYEEAYGREMDEQEFLDREDEYVLTFFLDEDRKWISSSILIHSWRIVLQDIEL